MLLRAQSIIFWPGMSNDIHITRAQCYHCNRIAPSQAPLPIKPASIPLTPFEQVFADFFHFSGYSFLVIGDRLSRWSEVFSTPTGTTNAGARGLIKCLRQMFATFGVPVQLSSDGGPEFSASQTKEFLSTWDVEHRISSAYHAMSNGRAEVAVKTTKRLLMSNVDSGGSINNDNFLRALLTLRNTPDGDCRLSPSQVLFGRLLRDTLSFSKKLRKYSQPMSPRWRAAWKSKEEALRTRYVRNAEDIKRQRILRPLKAGDRCFIQNQHGNHPKRWHLSGTIREALPHDKYVIEVDGSRRITTRNRRFLKLFRPITMYADTDDGIWPVPETSHQPFTKFDRTIRHDGASGSGDGEACNPAVPEAEAEIDQEPDARSVAQESPESTNPEVPTTGVDSKPPLMLRRLRKHNPDGVKQLMINPAGRRKRDGGKR